MVVRFLKILGGLFVAALILGSVLGVAGYFLFRNFDPNMFRPELERQLTRQTGFRVELGDIRLQWRPTPQFQVKGLKFYHPKSLEKILQSDQVRIDVDLASVWRKRLGASQVVIQSPEVFLARDRQGLWNWQPEKPAVPPAAASPLLSQLNFIPVAEAAEDPASLSVKGLGGIAQGWEFGIGKILVRDATVHFLDATINPPFSLELKSLQAEVRQKGYAALFHFKAGAAVFNSASQILEAEGDLDLSSQSLDLTLRYGPEKVEFRGTLKAVNTMPHFEGSLEIRGLDMEPVIPEAYKRGSYVSGRLSTKAQISLDGANPAIIKRSLKGEGTSGIKDGALRNRNVVREVFDRLSSVTAITNALGGELPPELSEMLKDRDTPFQSLDVAYSVESGTVNVREFRLAQANFQLSGKGTYGILDQRVEGSMELLLSPAISAFMVKKIRELSMIADRNGQVMIPFRYSGVFPNTAVQPDLSYIAARMLQGGAEQFLSQGLGGFSGILGPQTAATTSTVNPDIGAAQTAAPVSKKDRKKQWIAQGLNLLNQLQEPQKQ